jgi:hypothetical protein
LDGRRDFEPAGELNTELKELDLECFVNWKPIIRRPLVVFNDRPGANNASYLHPRLSQYRQPKPAGLEEATPEPIRHRSKADTPTGDLMAHPVYGPIKDRRLQTLQAFN